MGNIDLKSRGWRLRKATEDEGEGWLEEHTDGTKTRVYENPGEARREALGIEEERDTGSQPAAEPEQVEEASAAEPAADATDGEDEQAAHASDSEEATLAEAIVSELASVSHLNDFQKVVADYELQRLCDRQHDPRFTPQENVNIIAALDAAAEGLGMKGGPAAEAEPSDEIAEGEGEAQSLAAAIVSELNQVSTPEELRRVEISRDLDSLLRGRPDSRFSPEVRDAITAAFYEAEDRTSSAQVSGEANSTATGGELFRQPEPTPLIQQMLPSRMDSTPARAVRPEGLYPEQVERFRAEIRAGKRLPPVDIYYDAASGKNWVADGGHRQEAALLEGDAPLDVHVYEGTFDDALRHALGSNTKHGVPRSHAGSRMAVILALLNKEWSDPKHSNTDIAKMVDTSQPFVGQVMGWLLAMLPLILEDVDGERSDEEFDEAVPGAPKGFAALVRGLPRGRADVEQLSHNVMARAEARPAPKKAAAPEPDLFTASEPVEESSVEQQAVETSPDALLRLLDVLKAKGAKGATVEELKELEFAEPEALEELIQRGKARRKVERLENGRCYYLWSPVEVAEVVEARPHITPRELDELGCQDHVVRAAEQDGLIKPGSGDYTVGPRYSPVAESHTDSQPDRQEEASEKIVVHDRRRFADERIEPASRPDAPATQAHAAQQPEAPKPQKPAPSIEEMLKGRPMSLSYTWVPGVKGKINVSVNIGGKPANEATRALMDAASLLPLPELVMGMVNAEFANSNGKGPAQKSAAVKAGETPSPKVERIVKAIKDAKTSADLAAAEKHYRLSDLSRFSTGDAALIGKALILRRRQLPPPAAAAKKGGAKKSATKAAAKKGTSKAAKKSTKKK